ncbi:MAG: Type 1 glutamine amidotransferase-like domain-containing protein [Capnocytophaga felis]|nr:Type 1 glutamine amidotransferase-like domain-containing protein [Capnocytophaga felis]
MKKIFLCSSFKDVSHLFEEFADTNLAGKKVTFIPTASLTEKVRFYVDTGRKALEKMGLIIDELEISTATSNEILYKLQKNDFIYITGGNTFFLLQALRKSGTDKLIKEEVLSGKTYIGESAGAMILSPNIQYVAEMDNLKQAPYLQDFSALDLVDFYTVPHYNNFPFAKATEAIINKYKNTLHLLPITNSQAIEFRNDNVEIK